LVLVSGFGNRPSCSTAGAEIGLPGLVRDLGLVGVTLLSLKIAGLRPRANQFSWGPI
jgi:hypothetical protein